VIERPYWWDTVESDDFAGLRFRADDQLPSEVDVLVVGAGYTGLSAARRLAKSGASVVVLDREGVGWGASSRNGGQVVTGLRLDPATLVKRYGERRARELFDAATAAIVHLEALVAEERIACEYVRCGHLQAAWKPSHFDGFRAEQSLLARVFDHRVEIVSSTEQRREIGSAAYHGVMIDERSGALNPARYVNGLAEAARRAGACVRSGIQVRRVARERERWTVVTSAGSVSARDVLVATNGYTDRAAPQLRRRFVPVGSYIMATRPLREEEAAQLLPRRRVAFDSKNFLFYFRLSADRRLLFGGRAEFTQPSAASVRRAAETLRRGMIAIFPELEDVEVEYAWGGQVAFTRDQMPHAGRIDGVYFAGGYCGHGIAPATKLGDLIARRIAGEAVSDPLLDSDCPTIPFYRGTPWFLPLVGAYFKVRDWIS